MGRIMGALAIGALAATVSACALQPEETDTAETDLVHQRIALDGPDRELMCAWRQRRVLDHAAGAPPNR
jgi:hypothetical protein